MSHKFRRRNFRNSVSSGCSGCSSSEQEPFGQDMPKNWSKRKGDAFGSRVPE